VSYTLTENLAGLVTSCKAANLKYERALVFILAEFPFDGAALYLTDEKTGGFALAASGVGKGRGQGEAQPWPSSCAGDGLANLAKKSGEPVIAYTRGLSDTLYKGLEERALTGCRSLYVLPLMDALRCYGVLYLRSIKKTVLRPSQRRLLALAIVQLISTIKFSELIREYREASEEAEAAQAKIADAEKLLLLGDIAASLAHEIKNPLLCLGGFAARIKRKLTPTSPIMPDVLELTKAVKRLEGVITAMVAPLKEEPGPVVTNDINDIIKDTLGYFSEELKNRSVVLEHDFCSGALPVMAEKEELKIVFDNLIANAIQCMDSQDGGVLRLSTARADGWVIAEVSDNGGGIDPRDMASIFRPFFTTKKNGTGLGLPITSSIISRRSGVIDVINSAGEGVTFKVKLPSAGKKKTKRA